MDTQNTRRNLRKGGDMMKRVGLLLLMVFLSGPALAVEPIQTMIREGYGTVTSQQPAGVKYDVRIEEGFGTVTSQQAPGTKYDMKIEEGYGTMTVRQAPGDSWTVSMDETPGTQRQTFASVSLAPGSIAFLGTYTPTATYILKSIAASARGYVTVTVLEAGATEILGFDLSPSNSTFAYNWGRAYETTSTISFKVENASDATQTITVRVHQSGYE